MNILQLNNDLINQVKRVKQIKAIITITTLHNILFKTYEVLRKNTHYIFAIYDKNNIYKVKIKANELTQEMTKIGTSSKGGTTLKIRITRQMMDKWIASGKATKVCTKKYFEKIAKDFNTKGNCFEYLMVHQHKQDWKQNNIRFDKVGDLQLKRDKIEIKLWNATITTAKAMKNAMSEA